MQGKYFMYSDFECTCFRFLLIQITDIRLFFFFPSSKNPTVCDSEIAMAPPVPKPEPEPKPVEKKYGSECRPGGRCPDGEKKDLSFGEGRFVSFCVVMMVAVLTRYLGRCD